VIAFNLARAVATAAGIRKARWATLRRRIVDIPARIATTSRRLDLHQPAFWPMAVMTVRLPVNEAVAAGRRWPRMCRAAREAWWLRLEGAVGLRGGLRRFDAKAECC
jgi:hypothetical protein